MALLGHASLQFIIISVSGIADTARLFAAEYGTPVRLPCDENVEAADELSALSAFDAVWTDPRGVTLVGGGDDDQGSGAAELRGDPWVDAFSGDLSLAAVDFADAGEYSCSARYADGEALTEPRESKHTLQVYETPVAGQCECGCELIGNVCRVLHDFLIGLAVLACLSINLYALFKFSGPIVLDSLCEYVFKEANASKLGPGADVSDDALDDGMPDDVFDGISRLITRLKKRKLPKASGEEDAPLLPASEPAVELECSDDDVDQRVVCYNHDASPEPADDAPRIVPVGSLRHPKFPSVIRSGEDVFTDPGHSISERNNTSPEGEDSGNLSDVVALVGSPEADWISSGRRRWIGRYDVTVARTSKCESRHLLMASALADGLSERSGGTSSLPEQRATYDVFAGRWSSTETADSASDVSFLPDDSRSCSTGANSYGTFERKSGSSKRTRRPAISVGDRCALHELQQR
ncbi:uncharacterized protein LOC119465971 isoform X2 [Dermacentor silvarum]|uniref:uncharacterized protein LOC119465971 isoform X2 n=1 Tax=Dermacentor silvarum TaxID=543639 RepID=UPI002100A8F2|nr:uncharacterized protein LOC119465971 isoform X2 [Dermacentor silvarum]